MYSKVLPGHLEAYWVHRLTRSHKGKFTRINHLFKVILVFPDPKIKVRMSVACREISLGLNMSGKMKDLKLPQLQKGKKEKYWAYFPLYILRFWKSLSYTWQNKKTYNVSKYSQSRPIIIIPKNVFISNLISV